MPVLLSGIGPDAEFVSGFSFECPGSHWPVSKSEALLATRLQIKDFDIDSNYPQG